MLIKVIGCCHYVPDLLIAVLAAGIASLWSGSGHSAQLAYLLGGFVCLCWLLDWERGGLVTARASIATTVQRHAKVTVEVVLLWVWLLGSVGGFRGESASGILAVALYASYFICLRCWSPLLVRHILTWRGFRENLVVDALHSPDQALVEEILFRSDFLIGSVKDWSGAEQSDRAALVRDHMACGVLAGSDRVAKWESICEKLGLDLWTFSPDRSPVLIRRSRSRHTVVSLVVKEITDIIGAALLLLLASPLLLLIALLIRLTSPGPVFFRQQREGLYGKTFTMYKFRSMKSSPNPDMDVLAAEEPGDILSKPVHDPRTTPLGRFLRRTSLDELPQLWNVLMGDMSIVGPRPMPLYEIRRLSRVEFHRRACMKPGLTGIWQVSGRSKIKSMTSRMEMDLEYVDKWSLKLDFKILMLTMLAVFTADGAQ